MTVISHTESKSSRLRRGIPSMTTPPLSAELLAEFVPYDEKTPGTAATDRNVADAVLLQGLRTRRTRAWLRLGAVTAWMTVVIASGTHTWPLSLIWFVTVLITLGHAYRDRVVEATSEVVVVGAFTRWLLPEYRVRPSSNRPGMLDLVGCIVGGLLTGLLVPSWTSSHLFSQSAHVSLDYRAAAYVLAAIVMIGGSHIVASHTSWMQVGIREKGRWTLAWITANSLAVAVVFVTLWPGTANWSNPQLFFVLHAFAWVGTGLVCIYGRWSLTLTVRDARNIVADTRQAARTTDALVLHQVKSGATNLKQRLDSGPAILETLVAEHIEHVNMTIWRIENDEEAPLRSLAATVRLWVDDYPSRAEWAIEADLDPLTIRRNDAELIEVAAENLLSNAAKASATKFSVSLSVGPDEKSIFGHTMRLRAICTCGSEFVPPTDDRSGLMRLAKLVGFYNGESVYQNYDGGRHVFDISWPTLGIVDRPIVAG